MVKRNYSHPKYCKQYSKALVKDSHSSLFLRLYIAAQTSSWLPFLMNYRFWHPHISDRGQYSLNTANTGGVERGEITHLSISYLPHVPYWLLKANISNEAMLRRNAIFYGVVYTRQMSYCNPALKAVEDHREGRSLKINRPNGETEKNMYVSVCISRDEMGRDNKMLRRKAWKRQNTRWWEKQAEGEHKVGQETSKRRARCQERKQKRTSEWNEQQITNILISLQFHRLRKQKMLWQSTVENKSRRENWSVRGVAVFPS